MTQRHKARERRPLRRYRRHPREQTAAATTPPSSSHPEIEEEIVNDKAGCGADDSRIQLATPLAPARPIISVDGEDVDSKDVKEGRFRHQNAA